METISAAAEGRSYAPVHPCARTHRRVAAAAGGPQRPAGAADAAAGPRWRRWWPTCAPVGRPSYPPLLMVKVLLARTPRLWERLSFRRFVGLGLQDDDPITRQPLPHAAERRAWPRSCSRRWTATGRARAAVMQGTPGRDVGGRAGAPPERGRHRRGQPPGPGRGLGPAGPTGALRLQAAPGRGRRPELIRRAVLTPANVNGPRWRTG